MELPGVCVLLPRMPLWRAITADASLRLHSGPEREGPGIAAGV